MTWIGSLGNLAKRSPVPTGHAVAHSHLGG